MLWKNAAEHQLDEFEEFGRIALRHDKEATLVVVGAHMSKSISLPVIRLNLPNKGITVWLRDNFYDMAVTVEARREIDDLALKQADFRNVHSCYFQGFEQSRSPVYGLGIKSLTHSHFSFHHSGKDFGAFLVELIGAADRRK